MPQCAFKHCLNNHRNTKLSDGVSFFRFPSNPYHCAEWVAIVAKERGLEMYQPYKNSSICSIHFENVDIIGNLKRRRLLKTAIPKLQIHSHSINGESMKTVDTKTNILSKTDISSKKEICDIVQNVADVPNSPDSICISSKERFLEEKLTKYRNIINNKTRKICSLQKKNKRLIKKNAALQSIVNFKMKHFMAI